MKVLAIDDENKALKVLVDAIRDAMPTAEIFDTNDAYKLLEYAKANDVQIAFCDIQMNQINGIELAYKLKKINPKINIIFCTGYSEYAVSALKMHASGYLMKPVSSDDILQELNNLLHPIESLKPKIFIKTFGNFDIFVDGKPIYFAREKAKEMLAYLVYRKGSTVTRKEICAVLFEDRPMDSVLQNYCTKISSELIRALKMVGQDDIIIREHNHYAIDITKVTCDAYLFQEGDITAINSFDGEYMAQYSWAEDSVWLFTKNNVEKVV